MDTLGALPHRSLNDSVKQNIFNTIKQIKTVAEFINKICLIKEHAATQLLTTIETFKRRGNELKKENRCPLASINSTWDALLVDTENEARELLELSQKLVNSVCVPLVDKSVKMKTYLKKMFMNRETLESQLDKSEEIVAKSYKDYGDSWTKYKMHKQDPQKEQHVSTICYNTHNDYIYHLTGFNCTSETLYQTFIPEILTDVQTAVNDIGKSYSHLMQQFSQTQQQKLTRRMSKLQAVETLFGTVNVNSDCFHYVQSLNAGTVKIPKKHHENPEVDSNVSDVLGELLLLNPLTEPALKRKYNLLSKKAADLVNLIDRDKTAIKSLQQLRNSYVENPVFGNHDSTNEDVVITDFELKQKRKHFAVVSAQLDLFTKDMVDDMGSMEGCLDTDDSDGEAGYSRVGEGEKQAHRFINFTSKRPAFCNYCKGVLIGIVKPTVRCKVCKLMVHQKCKMNVPYCTGAPVQGNEKASVSRTTSIDSRSGYDDDDDQHLYSDIVEEIAKPPKGRAVRRHSGSALEGRAVFVNGSYGSSPNLVPSPPEVPSKKPPLKKKPEQCIILYDYHGASPGDLAIKAGQRISLANASEADWWEGSYKGKTGFFPASYALKLKDNDVVVKCLYDFRGEEDDELSISTGQILVLIEDEGNGWMVGRSADGEGIFPSSYVDKI